MSKPYIDTQRIQTELSHLPIEQVSKVSAEAEELVHVIIEQAHQRPDQTAHVARILQTFFRNESPH